MWWNFLENGMVMLDVYTGTFSCLGSTQALDLGRKPATDGDTLPYMGMYVRKGISQNRIGLCCSNKFPQ